MSLIQDFSWHYIAYDELKEALKTPYLDGHGQNSPHPQRRAWNEDDEKTFVQLLEAELDKVFTFQKLKSGEIVSRIKHGSAEVKEIVEKQRHLDNAEDEARETKLEDDFLLLEEDLSDIIADVHELAKFTQLNYTGFQKIIKKHDKQTGWYLRPSFATRLKAK